MELKEGTRVFTSSGEEVGRVNRFVLDPGTNEVTHIVVQKGWLLIEDKVVPIDWVGSETDEGITLKEESADFDRLPPFEERHYVQVDDESANMRFADDDPTGRRAPAYYWNPPHGDPGDPAYAPGYRTWPTMETYRNIPEGAVSLKQGARVIGSDDVHVGNVERLFMEPDSKEATHFLISQGLFFKERKLVPVHWVRVIENDVVHLSVSARMLESIPGYEE